MSNVRNPGQTGFKVLSARSAERGGKRKGRKAILKMGRGLKRN